MLPLKITANALNTVVNVSYLSNRMQNVTMILITFDNSKHRINTLD